MNIEILSPESKLFQGETSSVFFPGSDGQFQVLNNHAPMISSLGQGQILVKTPDGEKSFDIESGVVEVLNNKIIVLV